ncbi:MAG: hypothetical protein K2H37_03400 [Lachnospiraceae bacterium]|nr:hypothetical protein [Lachnospiraceae bacterium]
MNTPKDNHTITGSPLMCLEFIIIQTIIWGVALCVLYYFLEVLLVMPLFSYVRRLFFLTPLLYYVLRLFAWPNVMVTALIITIIRCVLRRTSVTLSGDAITIRRLRHTDRLLLADFIRPKTVESYVSVHFAAWVFRRRYLIFRNNAGKEVKYRLYEYSEKDLEQVMQLLTRVSRTEHLAEDDKTEIMMDAFQCETAIPIDPRKLWGRMAGRLILFLILSLVVFFVSTCLFYEMLFIPPQYDSGSVFSQIIGYGSILLSLCSLFLLCRALWTLAVNAVLKTSCPQRITFAGNMLQIDQTMYSVNRIQQVIMNSPAGKLPLFDHYQITLVTMDGRKRYWLGNAAGLRHDIWRTLCGNMQNLLVSCPAKLTYR